MPGQFGVTDAEDGVAASTTSSQYVGVSGRSDGIEPSPNGVGGSGVFGLTLTPGAAGVFGANNNSESGVGVQGNGPEAGVSGWSATGAGVRAHSDHGNSIEAFGHDPRKQAILAVHLSTEPNTDAMPGPHGSGLTALTHVPDAAAIFASNEVDGGGIGIQANGSGAGVSGYGRGPAGVGVRGHSDHGNAVEGFGHDPTRSALFGIHEATDPVPEGLQNPAGCGVWGHSRIPNGSGVCGSVEPGQERAAGVVGIGKIAGRFFGDVEVTGDLLLPGADFAEEFPADQDTGITAGMVVSVDVEGRLVPSSSAYDCAVVGVVSGAGGLRSGIVLDRQHDADRAVVALMGKVYVAADPRFGSIRPGDALTSSPEPGHAMRASDPDRSHGSVIGKALTALDGDDPDLVLMLVAPR